MRPLHTPFMVTSRYVRLARRVATKRRRFEQARLTFYQNYWASAAEEIGGKAENLESGYVRITKDDRTTLTNFHRVNIDTYLNQSLVANKPLVQRLLDDNGCPTPRFVTYDLADVRPAARFVAEIGRCVVKPSSGSGGAGITTAIDGSRRLRQASVAAASTFARGSLVIEEEIPGDSYRLLFLGGALVDAVQRKRPTVTGDGSATVEALIQRENEARLRGDSAFPLSFSGLGADLDCRFRLRDDGRNLSYVPPAGEVVVVKNVANQNSARENYCVRDRVHPFYHELGARICATLGLNLVGFDLMSADISVHPEKNGAAVNELNIPPGLHYHELVANLDDRAGVGPQVLSFIFDGAVAALAVPVTA